MDATTELHDLDLVSVVLNQNRPRSRFENHDVAFIPVTRFNLRMAMDPAGRFGHIGTRNLYESPEYDAYWRTRVEIFERVCLPSVVNLIPRPDAWYIAFGETRPPYIQELLERLAEYPWIVPYLRQGSLTSSDDPLPSMLTEHLGRLGKTSLCSTRLDSDDSLQQQFYGALDRAISSLRSKGIAGGTRCLNLMYGLVDDRGALSVFLRRSNMFESIFEPLEELAGPHRGPHDEIRQRMPLVEIVTNLPMWIYHRHDESIDPPRAMKADRLPIGGPELYYPMFGLDPALAPNAAPDQLLAPVAAPATIELDQSGQRATELRAARRWSTRQRRQAVELATSLSLAELAHWLESSTLESVDLAAVWHEIETADQTFLNGEHYALLGHQLHNQGQLITALRAYERAGELNPESRPLRATREALADSLLTELDTEEQIDLGLLRRSGNTSNTLAIVVSLSSLDGAAADLQSVEQRIVAARSEERNVLVLVLPSPDDGAGDDAGMTIERDGVMYELLPAPRPVTRGADAWQHAINRQLAIRLADAPPAALAADDSLTAQRAATAVARALEISLELTLPPDTDDVPVDGNDSGIGEIE